ncbi:MAG: hypothetical protein K0Q73_8765, partial [Paenibacillus sp.]|nr:hypothetical protein [Paenibacillus sp.]
AAGEHRIRAVAVDLAGHKTIKEFVFNVVVDAGQLIETLEIGAAKDWIKNIGILQSLKVKAQQAADAGDDRKKLEQALTTFEHEVHAQAGKGIESAFAALLLDNAAHIRDGLAD